MAHPRECTLALVAYVQVRLLALSDFRYDGKTPDGESFFFILKSVPKAEGGAQQQPKAVVSGLKEAAEPKLCFGSEPPAPDPGRFLKFTEHFYFLLKSSGICYTIL